jgi:hypothetical protein
MRPYKCSSACIPAMAAFVNNSELNPYYVMSFLKQKENERCKIAAPVPRKAH